MNAEQYQGLKDKLYAFKKEVLSDQLKIICCRIQPIITLAEDERKIIRKAVDKRRYEFSAGRTCAKKCLEYYGINNFSLLKGRYGEPLWPEGVTGSITHNSGLAFAVTMPLNQGGIGIDFVDLSEQLPSPQSILNDMEISTQFAGDLTNPELLLFSLKESVIKILSPVLQEYIEFKDILINLENGVVDVTYRGKKTGIDLSWFIYSNYAFTVAVKNNSFEVY